MKKISIIVCVLVFIAWFVLAKPKWIEIHNDSAIIDNESIFQATTDAEIGYGILILPLLEHNLQQLPLVKRIVVKQIMGGGLQIVIIPEHVQINLVNNYIISQDSKVVKGKYFPNFPVYDCPLSSVDEVKNWHIRHQALIAQYHVGLREVGYDPVSDQWRLLWDDGLVLLLGKTQTATKNLKHWLKLVPYFNKHKIDLAYHIFDMRYPDGFAYSAY